MKHKEARRPYGQGSIYQRNSDGRWCGAVRVQDADGQRRRRMFYGSTRAEVEKQVAAFNAERGFSRVDPQPGGRLAYIRDVASEGRHTAREWTALIRETGGHCAYCGTRTFEEELVRRFNKDPERTRHKDHRTPIVRGGSDRIDNIAVSCRRCNREKGLRTADEYLAWKAGR